MIPAALLATLWFLPTVSAVGGFIVALLFGGDWTEALLAAAVLAASVLALRLLGLKGALAVLAAGAVAIAYRRGERSGAARQIQKDKANADRAVQRANEARADADRRNADPRRLRDDDGFKRRD
ncbi:hypothetical protein [Xanthobacter aminoxidans]|uniref:hypothetical protein n=1 Tax=Xanthobacter aminoxidans TaxID=186280 RepID=UPI002022C117|nr:hypothetical protein [Xanthobacter aminoxidans]MCL8385851.1 hypothetical protein [Xanthobacter aminoxidans]